MAFWERTGRAIDWIIRLQVIGAIFGALGVGKLVQGITERVTIVSNPLSTAIWLLSSAAILGALAGFGHWWNKRKTPLVQTTTLAPTATGSMDFNYIDAFYAGHNSQFLQDVENAIRAEAQAKPTLLDRETFLVRGMTATILMGFFEFVWQTIFGSQLKALQRINAGPCTIEQLRPYFEHGLDQRPQYSFESWFGFLKNQLIIRQDGHNISITVRGREFLTWIVQQGRTAIDKPF